MTLVISRCTYAYGRRKPPVLRDLDYRLSDGVTLLLGPNGAGKSTLLRLAAAIAQPQHGSITLNGLSSTDPAYRRAVAWMPQHITPMTGLTAREQVAYTGWLKGMSRRAAWEESTAALRLVDLAEEHDKRAAQLSGGQLRRLGVAAALVHQADVLLLDEPTAGMDPTQRRTFRDVVEQLSDRIRVLLSTHDVADLAEGADQVTVLHQGVVRYHGTGADFLTHAPPETPAGRAAESAYTMFTG